MATINPTPAVLRMFTIPAPPFQFQLLNFNGTSTNWANAPNNVAQRPSTTWTAEARVKLNSTLPNQPAADVAIVNLLTSSRGYGIGFNKATTSYRVSVYLSPTYRTVSFNVSYFDANTVHHLAGTFDGRFVRSYVDGYLRGTFDLGTSGIISYVGNGNLNIGAQGIGTLDPASLFIDARIDDVRIWNATRTQNEICKFMFEEVDVSSTGLVGYYKCNEATGTTLTDSSATANNGTLNAGLRELLVYRPLKRNVQYKAKSPTITKNLTKSVTASTINITANAISADMVIHLTTAVANFSANNPTIITTIFTTPNIITFTANSATLIVGAVTIQATPAIVNFTANSISVDFTVYPTASTVNFVVSSPTIRLMQYATPCIITLSNPPPTSQFVIHPTPAIVTFNANGITSNIIVNPTAVPINFSANNIAIVFGGLTINPTATSAHFQAKMPIVSNNLFTGIRIHFVVKIFDVINYQVIIENT
jgi:hypothetical protein